MSEIVQPDWYMDDDGFDLYERVAMEKGVDVAVICAAFDVLRRVTRCGAKPGESREKAISKAKQSLERAWELAGNAERMMGIGEEALDFLEFVDAKYREVETQ